MVPLVSTPADQLRATLGSPEWLLDHESQIKKMLPKGWTPMHQLSGLKLGWDLKLLGLQWHSEDEFTRIMLFLEKIGMLQRRNLLVRANPVSIFAANGTN